MSLPDDRQAELFDFCDGLRTQGLRTIREKLETEKDVNVSLSTLSNWLNWYSMRSRFSMVAETSDFIARIMKETPGLNIEDEKVMKAANAYFTAKSLKESDCDTYVKMMGVRRGTAEIRIKERRLTLEEQKARQAEAAKEVTTNTSLTPEEKQQRYREIFGLK
jgi:hypothetical protein